MNDDLTFDEERHIYYLNGKPVPSVTQIINWKYDSLGHIDKNVLAQASERGSAVHKAIEDYELTGDYEIADKWQDYVEAYLDLKEEHDIVITSVEVRVVYIDEIFDYNYAGTRDNTYRRGVIIGSGDNKTSYNIKSKEVELQLSAYAIAWEQMTGEVFDEYSVFWLAQNGSYAFLKLEYKPKEWLNILAEYYESGGYEEWKQTITTIAKP